MRFSTKSNILPFLSLMSLVLTNTWALDSNREEQVQDISFLCEGSGNRQLCEVQLDIPVSCVDKDGTSDCPIIFFLHGSGGTIQWFAKTSGIHENGFIGVYPQGEGGWNTGPKETNVCEWEDYECSEDPNDGLFIANIIAFLRQEGAYGNVYAIGDSNGAALALRLAANAGDDLPIWGIATFAMQLLDTPERSGPGNLNYNKPRPGSQKVSVLSVMGTADGLIPYEGGTSAVFGGDDAFVLKSALQSMEFWATHNECSKIPILSALGSDQGTGNVAKYVFPDCADGAVVEHYAIEGGGHNAGGADIDGVKVSYDLAYDFIRNVEGDNDSVTKAGGEEEDAETPTKAGGEEGDAKSVVKAACEDDPDWRGEFNADHTCAYVADSPETRCVWQSTDGTRAFDACPETCGICDANDSDNKDDNKEGEAIDEAAVDEAAADEERVDEAAVDEAALGGAAVDEEALDEAALGEAALGEAAVDEAALDEAALDEEALDEAAADEERVDEEGAIEAAVDEEGVVEEGVVEEALDEAALVDAAVNDDLNWSYERPLRPCRWVSKKPTKRCDKVGTNGKFASEACRRTCSKFDVKTSEIGELIIDDESWFYTQKPRPCRWVSKKPTKRCDKIGTNGKLASDACRAACSELAVKTSEIDVRRALRRGN